MPTTNSLIEDLHNKGLAMKRGGAEHMMIHNDMNTNHDEDDDHLTKQQDLKEDLIFLKSLPKKMKHRLAKRLKHLERHGAIKV